MSDPFSLAVGVAGLVGLSGQIFSGCVFIKSFLEDVRNAPKSIAALKAELETIAAAAKSFDQLVSECAPNEEQWITTEEYAPALNQCLDVINGLQKYIADEVARFAGGKRWLDRVKSAGKNSAIEKHLARLLRASSIMQMTQNNLVVSLQQRSQLSIQELHGAVRASAVPLHVIQNNQLEMASGFRKLEQSLQVDLEMTHRQGNTAIDLIDRNQKTALSGFHEIGSTLQAIQAQIAAERDSVAKMNDNFLSAVVQASAQNAMSVFRKEFPTHEGSESNIAFAPTTPRDEIDRSPNQAAKGSRHLIYQRNYEFYFVRVVIRRYGTFGGPSRTSIISTKDTILLHFNLPRFHRGFDYTRNTIQESFAGGITHSLRSYHIVPDIHPLWQACDILDFAKVQELFAAGLASPFDTGPDGVTPFTRVLFRYSLNQSSFQHLSQSEFDDKSSNALKLINLLAKYTDFYNKESYYHTLLFFAFSQALRSGLSVRYLADLLRLLLSRDCFPKGDLDPAGIMHHGAALTLSMKDTEIYPVLLQFQATKLPAFKAFLRGRELWENSRQILDDPEAEVLKYVFEHYRPCTYYVDTAELGLLTLWALLSLHLLVPQKYAVDMRHACRARLGVLYAHSPQWNLRERKNASISPSIARTLGLSNPNKHPTLLNDGRAEQEIQLYLSTLEFADAIDQRPLLHESLLLANWTNHSIENLYDEELYEGVPKLLNHSDSLTPYLSREEARAAFKNALCRGTPIAFAQKEDWDRMKGGDGDYRGNWEGVEDIAKQWSSTLQLSPFLLEAVMKNASLAWRQRRTPGTWIDDDRQEDDNVLVPGRDFTCICQEWAQKCNWCLCDE